MDDVRKFIGKTVKDPYGKDLGKLVGVASNIKSEISSVSIELPNGDYENFPSKQLSINGEAMTLLHDLSVEADELIRELDLLRRRDRALNELLAGGDVDETTYKQLKEQFRQAKDELLKTSETAVEKLAGRIQRLDEQIKSIQSLIANNKMHYTSGEIGEDAYSLANESIQNGLRHVSSERKSIEDKINALIASRDSAEEVGTLIPEMETKSAQGSEQTVVPAKTVTPSKIGGPRDIVIVRMEP